MAKEGVADGWLMRLAQAIPLSPNWTGTAVAAAVFGLFVIWDEAFAVVGGQPIPGDMPADGDHAEQIHAVEHRHQQLDLEGVEHGDDVAGEGRARVGAGRSLRSAMPALIDAHDAAVAAERRCEPIPDLDAIE